MAESFADAGSVAEFGSAAGAASDLSAEWNDADTSLAVDKTELLHSAFERGIWNQHLADQANRAASVQGVRFFFAPAVATPVEQRSDEDVLLGVHGYITALPATVQLDETSGELKVSLSQMKAWLQSNKAWETNRRAYASLIGTVVPLLHMHRGRPKDRRFGGNDALLGTFLVREDDASVLSCTLVARGTGALNDVTVMHASRAFLTDNRGVKRRRRDLPLYSPAGGLMGPSGSFAVNGASCKDVWIAHIQQAQCSIRVNAFCISDPDIIEELRRATARRVLVRVRYDARQQAKTQQGLFEDDRMRHILVHPVELSADERAIMHKKELLVDAAIEDRPGGLLVVGSYNPTSNARGNQESVFVLADAAVVGAVALRFDQDWAQETRNRERDVLQASLASPPGERY